MEAEQSILPFIFGMFCLVVTFITVAWAITSCISAECKLACFSTAFIAALLWFGALLWVKAGGL
ncbi:hypothetical protein COT48_03590 [Candidatus Woesearchaeota archaeon CG08_land_8_20_14_0_20_47_9]|nr:MAG: hypothetical protein AUJ69_01160 [Candidatus Woesearchaeota archaeon CG1_02_47_18]PIO03761.1 MAG: hypothetical protein COT48_03590 [Candidatus Woesearchaeota archaeon CG08_land_8_20_14_0_20_47_9]HII29935.1 hypothetical protein [Candidatus Woesearchaeota archaeon]